MLLSSDIWVYALIRRAEQGGAFATIVRKGDARAGAVLVKSHNPRAGETRLFIHPPYTFRAVDRLLTNFHLPRSTLLMLVCAFGGYERVMRAYDEAVNEGYRFYSYGDAMVVM